MSGALIAPILGGVQQLLARLSAARAAKIDDILVDTAALDARITATRASYIDAIKASTDSHTTSLSTLLSRLTDVRAAKLDKIFGIKSIQRGTIMLASGARTATATITAVDTSKALLFHLGQETDQLDPDNGSVRLTLTDATTVTASRWNTGGNVTVSYQVLELD